MRAVCRSLLLLLPGTSLAFFHAPSAPRRAYILKTNDGRDRQKTRSARGIASLRSNADPDLENETDGWIPLSSDGRAVKKRILEQPPPDAVVPSKGDAVEINYVGTLTGFDGWDVEDVTECWLKSQQGVADDLFDAFRANGVDGAKLTDDEAFTEEFVTNELGVSKRISCKKLVMAAKRLGGQREEFPAGSKFDSNEGKGPFRFVLGAGKVIAGMELGVSSMKIGERAQIICRADYAYGKEGYRKRTGEVMVPPFATLCFEIELLNCADA